MIDRYWSILSPLVSALGADDFEVFAVADGDVVAEEVVEGDVVAAI